MKGRKHTPEQIVRKLREADRLLAEGQGIADVSKTLEISEQIFHRWRNQYDGMKADDAKELRKLRDENQRLKRMVADQALDLRDPARGGAGKLVSPARRREAVVRVEERLSLSERRACRAVGQHRSTQRHRPRTRAADEPIRRRLREISKADPRFGYRRAWAVLQREGFSINRKRVQRLWREEGLRVPPQRLKRRRLGTSTVPAERLVADHRNHVWALDFLPDPPIRNRPDKETGALTQLRQWASQHSQGRSRRHLSGESIPHARCHPRQLRRGAPGGQRRGCCSRPH
jgi:putative transposase